MTRPSRKAVRRVNRLMQAADDYAFMGAAHPDDRLGIENEMAKAEKSLLDYIAELERAARTG